jgi:hypothetical protein
MDAEFFSWGVEKRTQKGQPHGCPFSKEVLIYEVL